MRWPSAYLVADADVSGKSGHFLPVRNRDYVAAFALRKLVRHGRDGSLQGVRYAQTEFCPLECCNFKRVGRIRRVAVQNRLHNQKFGRRQQAIGKLDD